MRLNNIGIPWGGGSLIRSGGGIGIGSGIRIGSGIGSGSGIEVGIGNGRSGIGIIER